MSYTTLKMPEILEQLGFDLVDEVFTRMANGEMFSAWIPYGQVCQNCCDELMQYGSIYRNCSDLCCIIWGMPGGKWVKIGDKKPANFFKRLIKRIRRNRSY